MAVKRAKMLSLWSNFGELERDAKTVEKKLSATEKVWTKWVGREGTSRGGALTKKMAADFANYLRADFLSGRAFDGMPRLSPSWESKKKAMELDPRIGIATKRLVENIKFMDQGYGKFTVGVHRDARAPTKTAGGIGNIKEVWKYFMLLEHGYKKGQYHQPPRPAMISTFAKWINEKAPKHVSGTVMEEIKRVWGPAVARMAHYMPVYGPEAYYSATVDQTAGLTSEAAKEFARTTKTGYKSGKIRGEVTSGTRKRPQFEDYTPIGGFPERPKKAKKLTGFKESERAEPYVGGGGRPYMTKSGSHVWSAEKELWVNIEEYFDYYYGSKD